MLKTIKYELKKSRTFILIFLLLYVLLEGALIIGVALNKETLSSVSFALFFALGFGATIFVLTAQVLGYSRELRDKSGYLVFMTPLSSRRILGAKLLTTLVCAAILGAFAGLLQVFNYQLIAKQFHLESVPVILNMALSELNTSVEEILLIAITWIVYMFISCAYFVCLSFFAISLSATLLQNKRGKGIIAGIIFLVLFILFEVITSHLPQINVYETAAMVDSVEYGKGFILANLPGIVFQVLCSIACWAGSAWLLDNRISL